MRVVEVFWRLWKRGHQRYQESLSDYMDGRLDARDQGRLEEHFSRCEECVRDLESLRATVQLLQRVPLVDTPRSFQLQEMPVLRPARPLFLRAMQVSTAVAGVLLAVLLVGDLLGSFGDGAMPPEDRTQVAQEEGQLEALAATTPPTMVPAPS
ncbi:MAG: zf-HC2 domain-containing protein, partial [Dehalococcoidia bacterium]